MIARRMGKERSESFVFYLKLGLKALLFIAFLYVLSSVFNKSKTYFPIKSVKVYGVQHTDQTLLQQTLTPLVSKGFFAIDVEMIKENLLRSTWVAKATVQKIWPDQVAITVEEKEPIARWNTKLLTNTGDIFEPDTTTIPNGLPRLIGPEGEQLEILQQYRKLSSLLSGLHFKIARLELTEDHAWSLTLDNGIKVNLGYKDGLTRMGHFVKVYPKVIGKKFAAVESIDLRYTNGLAVRWKTIT